LDCFMGLFILDLLVKEDDRLIANHCSKALRSMLLADIH
jgi:hypothetical protein